MEKRIRDTREFGDMKGRDLGVITLCDMSGALDRQLCSSSITSYDNTIITHNQSSDIYPLLKHKLMNIYIS